MTITEMMKNKMYTSSVSENQKMFLCEYRIFEPEA